MKTKNGNGILKMTKGICGNLTASFAFNGNKLEDSSLRAKLIFNSILSVLLKVPVIVSRQERKEGYMMRSLVYLWLDGNAL